MGPPRPAHSSHESDNFNSCASLPPPIEQQEQEQERDNSPLLVDEDEATRALTHDPFEQRERSEKCVLKPSDSDMQQYVGADGAINAPNEDPPTVQRQLSEAEKNVRKLSYTPDP
jgi:hypothetical protein